MLRRKAVNFGLLCLTLGRGRTGFGIRDSGFGIRDSGFGIREHDAPRGTLKVKLESKCIAILTTHFISLIYVNLKANCPHTGNYQRAPLEAKHSKSARAHQTKREPR